MRRAPVTLWLHVLSELWRLILLTTAILVTVLSFAGAVRFLADGRLGPIETIRWMFLMMPPMLQYALPFAAGFGATLAYHRTCSDNELTAGYAAGISHRAILAPALLSGAILAGVVLLLSNLIIPRFLRSAEELITRDAARMIVNSIERKEAVKMDNMLLYADLVRRYPATPDQDFEKLYLKGVMCVVLDAKGGVKSHATASEADVWLRRVARTEVSGSDSLQRGVGGGGEGSESVTHVTVRAKGMVGASIGGQLAAGSNVFGQTIPNAFSDDPKFLSWDELVRLREEPERLNFIDSRRRLLAARLAERATTGAIARSLAAGGVVRLLGAEGDTYTIHAVSTRWDPAPASYWVLEPGNGPDGKPAPLLVERRTESGRIVLQQAQAATFRTDVDADDPEHQVTISLTLSGLSASQESARRDPGSPALVGAQLKPKTTGDLVVTDADVAPIMSANTASLLDAADERLKIDPADDYVKGPRDDLRRRVADLMREITSKQHERFASAAACMVMILTGAVMAIRLRSKLPLEVYLWAFFPALATVITISAGQQMIHSNGAIGIPLMWAGVAGLGVYTFIQYRHVARR